MCWWWVIASHSQVVIKDLRLILARTPGHTNLDTSRSFGNSSISSPVGQRAAFHAEMALLIPPAKAWFWLVLRSIPFGFGPGLAPAPATFLHRSPPSSETCVPRCDGPPRQCLSAQVVLPAVHTGFADQFERRVEPRGFAGDALLCLHRVLLISSCLFSWHTLQARPVVWRHLRTLLTQCNPVEVTCAGLSFYRVSFTVNLQGDPKPPVTSTPQLGLTCPCSVAWGAVDSCSARE